MKTLSKKTPARRRLFVQAYEREGEWDTPPYHTLKENCIMKTAHGIRKALLNSRIRLIAGVLALGSTVEPVNAGLWDNLTGSVKAWYADDSSEAYDESTIPQTPVEYAGRVDLILKEQIELAFDEDTPGIVHADWMGFSPEGTLLLTDRMGKQALEFSRTDGQYKYIRSIGRSGSGPGEYLTPKSIDIDSQGRLYILDPGLGYLHRYDRQGQYLDRTRRSKGSQIATGRAGEVFLIWANRTPSGHIMELQRLDPATYEPIYRIPLSTSQQPFISAGFGSARLAYSPTRHRLYYMMLDDYKVTEIDADTGRLVRQFGHQLERYASLPERYYNLKNETFEDRIKLDREMSSVTSMVLVQEQYIFVTYQHPSLYDDLKKHALKWEGIVYDLKTPDLIKAYAFEEAIQYYHPDPADSSIVHFKSIPGNDIAHWDGRLYIYQSPLPERAKHSNGTVEAYEPVFHSQ